MDDRLIQQDTVIKTNESKINEYRNNKYHLQNFKSVNHYQVTDLKAVHESLTEYAENLSVE